jgi:hypothetical protein
MYLFGTVSFWVIPGLNEFYVYCNSITYILDLALRTLELSKNFYIL